MPYEYLEDIATADAAFEARGQSVEEMFTSAAEAVMNLMVEELDSIAEKEKREIRLEEESVEMLLFELMQELIYYKDAERLLLRAFDLKVSEKDGKYRLSGQARGEEIDPEKHRLNVDVKAVTFHRYRVEKTDRGWEATVVVDI